MGGHFRSAEAAAVSATAATIPLMSNLFQHYDWHHPPLRIEMDYSESAAQRLPEPVALSYSSHGSLCQQQTLET